jgi:hypothetical protein
MLYVDTSVLVALCTHEDRTESAIRWYQGCKAELASAVWCVTEFASALSLKERTGQLDHEQAQAAWMQFERVCANDLQLLAMNNQLFHKAAELTRQSKSGLRAGDALHLASALHSKAKTMVTFDQGLAKSSKLYHLQVVMP